MAATSAEQVFVAARQCDHVAIRVVQDQASHLAKALAVVVAVHDPS